MSHAGFLVLGWKLHPRKPTCSRRMHGPEFDGRVCFPSQDFDFVRQYVGFPWCRGLGSPYPDGAGAPLFCGTMVRLYVLHSCDKLLGFTAWFTIYFPFILENVCES